MRPAQNRHGGAAGTCGSTRARSARFGLQGGGRLRAQSRNRGARAPPGAWRAAICARPDGCFSASTRTSLGAPPPLFRGERSEKAKTRAPKTRRGNDPLSPRLWRVTCPPKRQRRREMGCLKSESTVRDARPILKSIRARCCRRFVTGVHASQGMRTSDCIAPSCSGVQVKPWGASQRVLVEAPARAALGLASKAAVDFVRSHEIAVLDH